MLYLCVMSVFNLNQIIAKYYHEASNLYFGRDEIRDINSIMPLRDEQVEILEKLLDSDETFKNIMYTSYTGMSTALLLYSVYRLNNGASVCYFGNGAHEREHYRQILNNIKELGNYNDPWDVLAREGKRIAINLVSRNLDPIRGASYDLMIFDSISTPSNELKNRYQYNLKDEGSEMIFADRLEMNQPGIVGHKDWGTRHRF